MKKEQKKDQKSKKPEVSKKASAQTKNRKSGEKVRKRAPAQRIEATLAKFQRQVHAAKVERNKLQAAQIQAVRDGTKPVMAGGEYQQYLAGINTPVMSAEKVKRVLG